MNYRGRPFTDLPRAHYACALIDPPWKYLTWSAKGMGRSPDRHYDTMTLDDIKAIPLRDVLAPKAIVFCWVIDTHVAMGLELLKAWGLTYKTVGFYWAKTNKDGTPFMGSGHWTRANPEHAMEAEYEQEVERCFLATTKQGPKRQNADVRRLIISPRREHSRKPDEQYERIERLVDGPYLEMFSRTERPAWDVWGDQAGLFTDHGLVPDAPLHPVLGAYLAALELA